MLHIRQKYNFKPCWNLAENKQGIPLVKDSNPWFPALRSGTLPLDQLALADEWQFEPALKWFRHRGIQYTQSFTGGNPCLFSARFPFAVMFNNVFLSNVIHCLVGDLLYVKHSNDTELIKTWEKDGDYISYYFLILL